jgi:[ribosomal protein S5]-alanine N-acetyltransferase
VPEMPRLSTERLVLRPFTLSDGPDVEQLAGDRLVADTTLAIPHPYPVGGGATWIATHADAWDRGVGLTLAICARAGPQPLMGAVSLHVAQAHRHGEIGYWIRADAWGNGYATEAARSVISYAFAQLGLHRVMARHFTRNAASGRVMHKLGMQLEGVHRDAYLRWGRFEDVAVYAVLASEHSY